MILAFFHISRENRSNMEKADIHAQLGRWITQKTGKENPPPDQALLAIFNGNRIALGQFLSGIRTSFFDDPTIKIITTTDKHGSVHTTQKDLTASEVEALTLDDVVTHLTTPERRGHVTSESTYE